MVVKRIPRALAQASTAKSKSIIPPLFEIKLSNPHIREKIQQRRRQMLIHSRLYYELDTSTVDDHTWQRWANELAQLQIDYPKESREVAFAQYFEGWTGGTGFELPIRERFVIEMTDWYLYCCKKCEERKRTKCQKSNAKRLKTIICTI